LPSLQLQNDLLWTYTIKYGDLKPKYLQGLVSANRVLKLSKIND